MRTHARVLARGILTLPHVRDNSSVSAAPSACTLHTRTCPPFTCCHSHLTTFLIQACSHRLSTCLSCVRTHARALARGILTFTHVPRQLLELPRTRVRPRVSLLPAPMFCDNSLYPCGLGSVFIPPVARTRSPHQCCTHPSHHQCCTHPSHIHLPTFLPAATPILPCS